MEVNWATSDLKVDVYKHIIKAPFRFVFIGLDLYWQINVKCENVMLLLIVVEKLSYAVVTKVTSKYSSNIRI
jgi:hypothetical protein